MIENVSDTALWVAAHRARESEKPGSPFRDPLSGKLAGEKGRAIARKMPYGAITGWIMAVRTVALDRLLNEALADGVDTVINLGAGLDTRPYRMDLASQLRWIEIDFPHTIDYKNAQLANEKPRCELRRIGLDLSDRAAANRVYAELGRETKRALVITEGVIAYLTNEQAADLARDLRAVPTFRYWLQDYRRGDQAFRRPGKLKKHLRHSPFRFNHPDPFALFGSCGWKAVNDVLAWDEGLRLGRPFPFPFPGNLLFRFAPKQKKEEFRVSAGFALFRAD